MYGSLVYWYMLRNYLRLAFRSLWNRRFYSTLNILGLSLSMAGGLILFQFIHYHLSFDRYHQKSGQLYRIVTELHLPDGSIEYEQGTPPALAPTLQKEMPQVKGGAVLLEIRDLAISIPGRVEGKNFQEQNTAAYGTKIGLLFLIIPG
jgi:putative ABC transport system permease protein